MISFVHVALLYSVSNVKIQYSSASTGILPSMMLLLKLASVTASHIFVTNVFATFFLFSPILRNKVNASTVKLLAIYLALP